MKVSFLGQGLDSSKQSVGNILLESLSDKRFNKLIFFVAFASQSGINGLSQYIKKSKKHMNDLKIFIGIDQKGTSRQALESLLKLNIDTKIYFTISRIIFHPKIYLFEGEHDVRILIGSANLTETGLLRNIEASLVVEFVKSNQDGMSLLGQIYKYFKSFLNGKGKNTQPLTKELIRKLYKSNLIPNEKERQKLQEKKDEEPKKEKILQDILNLFPSIKIQGIPKGFRRKRISRKLRVKVIKKGKISKKGLLWRKTNLPPSDVQHAKPGTHPTGGLRLVQAGWKVNNRRIDQTRYFRYSLFRNFTWQLVSTSPKVEVAKVLFNVKILGSNKGQHRLEIRYKARGEAGQRNYTTSLSWGKLGSMIQKQDLRGKTFLLYGLQQGKQEPFYIEIK